MRNFSAVLFIGAALAATACLADDKETAGGDYKLVLENHRWQPQELVIPADKKVRVLIENRDDMPEEFDSRDLNREKVVSGKSQAWVYIGPLKPGRYKFQGEMHADTAQGVVIAK